jgi:hypothetical protein
MDKALAYGAGDCRFELYAAAIDVTRVRFLGDAHNRLEMLLAPIFTIRWLEYLFTIEET